MRVAVFHPGSQARGGEAPRLPQRRQEAFTRGLATGGSAWRCSAPPGNAGATGRRERGGPGARRPGRPQARDRAWEGAARGGAEPGRPWAPRRAAVGVCSLERGARRSGRAAWLGAPFPFSPWPNWTQKLFPGPEAEAWALEELRRPYVLGNALIVFSERQLSLVGEGPSARPPWSPFPSGCFAACGVAH